MDQFLKPGTSQNVIDLTSSDESADCVDFSKNEPVSKDGPELFTPPSSFIPNISIFPLSKTGAKNWYKTLFLVLA